MQYGSDAGIPLIQYKWKYRNAPSHYKSISTNFFPIVSLGASREKNAEGGRKMSVASNILFYLKINQTQDWMYRYRFLWVCHNLRWITTQCAMVSIMHLYIHSPFSLQYVRVCINGFKLFSRQKDAIFYRHWYLLSCCRFC